MTVVDLLHDPRPIGVLEALAVKEEAPDEVTDFFRVGYPDMQSVQENVAVAENAGYKMLSTHVLPREAWVDNYYDILGPRAQALLDHPDAQVREFATETVREIDVFNLADDSYGYVFYVLERPLRERCRTPDEVTEPAVNPTPVRWWS